jgi:hypothetical protein
MMGRDGSLDSSQLPHGSPTKPKTHECSICGLEFAIWKALGGHMRRHRQRQVPLNLEERQHVSLGRFSLGTKRRCVGVGEAKIESLGINRSRDRHVGGIPSNLPEKIVRRFDLQLFEISGE